MIIIPEKKLVLITPPRTGSTLLKEEVPKLYPQAFQPYRHMEADGVPHGYDNWRRIGVFRPPVQRLWCLYNWCRNLVNSDRGTPAWRRRVYCSVNLGFEKWLLNNDVVFTDPYDSGCDDFHPRYTVLHAIPENRKSLRRYIRPDLGTEVMTLPRVLAILGVSGERIVNSAFDGPPPEPPELSGACLDQLMLFHSWDFEMTKTIVGQYELERIPEGI